MPNNSGLREIPCPCCRKPLFVLIEVTKGDTIELVTPESPRVETDDAGSFITCPHCSKRVVMLPNHPPGSRAGYYVSPSQPC